MPGPARTAARRTRSTILATLVAVGAALAGVLTWQSLTPSPSLSALSASLPGLGANTVARGDHEGAPGEADGVVPDGVTVFDDEFPAVAELEPDLLTALRAAATDAADDGVEFHVNSGWRSPAYQNQLLRQAISKYGSEEEAARWVATAETSAHVSGDAVDIDSFDA